MNGNLLKKGIFVLRATRKIKNLNKTLNYDGILSFWYREAAMIGRMVSSRCSIKHFTWLLGQDVKRTNKYMKFIRPKSQEIVAISKFQNDYLYKEFGFLAHKTTPIAVEPSIFPMLNEAHRPIDILGAGSMIPLKNHELFLEVVLCVKKRKKDLSVVLVGNGPQESKIRQFIKLNGLEETVKLTGLLSHTETLNYMNNSRIFLHTSKFEGGCTVCFESIFSGCHLISTLPIVKDSNPNFSRLDQKEAIVKKITALLSGTQSSFKRSADTTMDEACSEFYKLFF
jgi:glycosyltransferase involved in cell wall biosynthesis